MIHLKWRPQPRSAAFTVIVILVAFIIIFPLYVVTKNAFVEEKEITGRLAFPWSPIPQTFTTEWIYSLLTQSDLLSSLTQTILSTLLSVGLSLLLATPAAWAIVRVGGKRKTGLRATSFIMTFAVMSRMFPSITVGIPLAVILIRLLLHDTIWGLAIGFTIFSLPYSLIVMKGQFETIPPELEEAAMVDGYSRVSAFVRVTLPAAAPGMAAAAIFSFLFAWGELTLPLLITSANRPLSVMIWRYLRGATMAQGSAIAFIQLIPVLIFTYILQRFLKPEYLAGAFKY